MMLVTLCLQPSPVEKAGEPYYITFEASSADDLLDKVYDWTLDTKARAEFDAEFEQWLKESYDEQVQDGRITTCP